MEQNAYNGSAYDIARLRKSGAVRWVPALLIVDSWALRRLAIKFITGSKLDFIHLGRVAEQAAQVVTEGVRDFLMIGCQHGSRKKQRRPEAAAYQS